MTLEKLCDDYDLEIGDEVVITKKKSLEEVTKLSLPLNITNFQQTLLGFEDIHLNILKFAYEAPQSRTEKGELRLEVLYM